MRLPRPSLGEPCHGLFELLLGGLAPRPVAVDPFPDLRPLEDEGADPIGMRGGEQDGERPALRLTEQRGAVAAGCVHDGLYVVHALLERGRAGHSVGHPHAALIEQDDPGELAEPLAVMPERGQFPVDLEVGVRALGVDEIDRSVADDPVGDVDAAAPREPHLAHWRQRPPGRSIRQGGLMAVRRSSEPLPALSSPAS